jgi:hypothetical protein
MTRKLVFWTALNSYRSEKCLRGLSPGSAHPVTTSAWTARRVGLWRKFTLNSILAQAADDWLYVVLLDPELKRLTEPLLPRRDSRVLYCYEDNPTLENLRAYDEIVLALIDGDDMYSRSAGRLMMRSTAEWMFFKLGYAYEVRTGKLWEYDTIGTGPFFARRVDPKKLVRFDRDKRHPTHKTVAEQKPECLPAGHFCVLLHDINTSSHPGMRYVLRDKPADPGILRKEFGR